MKVEIKSIISPDILDFTSFDPLDKQSFSFLLELVIGTNVKEGGDLFSIEVCTPKWLLENYKKEDVLFCRHKLIVFEYDIDRIIYEIKFHLELIGGNSWQEIANQLSKIAHWEYEDYKV